MIRRQARDTFADLIGPLVLTLILIIALAAQITIKLYDLIQNE